MNSTSGERRPPRCSIWERRGDSADPDFADGATILRGLAERGKVDIRGVKYTVSRKWGHVIRARIVHTNADGKGTTSQFVWWRDPEGGARFLTR